MKSKGGVAQAGCRHAGNPNINSLPQHVPAVLSHPGGSAAKKFVAPLRAVSTDNVDLRPVAADRHGQVMQQVKQRGVQQVDLTRAMIAKKMVKLIGGVR